MSLFFTDPPIYTTGPAIPTKGGVAIGAAETASIIVMPASEFQYKSVILGFEFYAEATGDIEILVSIQRLIRIM